jgi:hypothetical protein
VRVSPFVQACRVPICPHARDHSNRDNDIGGHAVRDADRLRGMVSRRRGR